MFKLKYLFAVSILILFSCAQGNKESDMKKLVEMQSKLKVVLSELNEIDSKYSTDHQIVKVENSEPTKNAHTLRELSKEPAKKNISTPDTKNNSTNTSDDSPQGVFNEKSKAYLEQAALNAKELEQKINYLSQKEKFDDADKTLILTLDALFQATLKDLENIKNLQKTL
jgi:hypothetical protein